MNSNTSQLSFEPEFHRYVVIGETTGWMVDVQMIGSADRFQTHILAEQRRIEDEGGPILVVDFKHP